MSLRDIFYFLWQLGLWPQAKCPYDGKTLEKRGQEPMVFWVCPDDQCRFNANEAPPGDDIE